MSNADMHYEFICFKLDTTFHNINTSIIPFFPLHFMQSALQIYTTSLFDCLYEYEDRNKQKHGLKNHQQSSHQLWEAVPVVTEITQPCVHTHDSLFICQLYLLPELLEEMDSKEDTPLTLPFASFVSLSQLIIVI
jgi:hypothetical protein